MFSDNLLLSVRNRNQLINNTIYWLFNFNVDVFDNFHFNNPLLNDWNLNYSFNITDDNFLNFLYNNLFNDLRHLDNFFDYSWNDNNFLDDSFNFNHFWHFNHLLNDLINLNSHFLDSVDVSWNFNNFFLNVLYWLWYLHVMIDNFLNLNKFRLSNNHRVS